MSTQQIPPGSRAQSGPTWVRPQVLQYTPLVTGWAKEGRKGLAGLKEKHSPKPASNKVASNARCKGNGSLMRRLLELQRFADENVILPEDVSGKILRILTMGRPHSGLQQTVACVLTVSLREFREGQAAG